MEELKNLFEQAKGLRGSCSNLNRDQIDLIFRMCRLYQSLTGTGTKVIKCSQCAAAHIISSVHKLLKGNGLV